MSKHVKLDDSAVIRIKQGIEQAQARNASKHQTVELIKKTASKSVDHNTEIQHTIKLAGIQEIPVDFERIGTGFYRQGHHLWELSSSSDGLTLVRKRGEDHVLGYDPEPITKTTGTIVDRFGSVIKTGSKVLIPHGGKLANATVVVIQPGALQVELNSGEAISVPPDMTEVCGQEEPFDPEIEPSSKAEPEMVEEQDEEDEVHASKVAAPAVTPQPVKPGEPPSVPPPIPEPSKRSEILMFLESAPDGTVVEANPKIEGSKYSFLIKKLNDDQYELFTVERTKNRFATYNKKQLVDWEFSMRQNTGEMEFRKASSLAVSLMQKISSLVGVDIHSWDEYWYELGQRVGGRQLTPEQREQRKQRRKERKLERIGLPKGVKLPPKRPEQQSKAKLGAKDTDQLAQLKERTNLLQQTLDQIKFLVQDESLRENEEQLVNGLGTIFTEYEEQLEDLDSSHEEEMEDVLSIETPPQDITTVEPKTSKPQFSMSDLKV